MEKASLIVQTGVTRDGPFFGTRCGPQGVQVMRRVWNQATLLPAVAADKRAGMAPVSGLPPKTALIAVIAHAPPEMSVVVGIACHLAAAVAPSSAVIPAAQLAARSPFVIKTTHLPMVKAACAAPAVA